MPGAGFSVTKGARRAASHIGGTLDAEAKALANRRIRRRVRQELHACGVEADPQPRLYTDWDVI